MGLIVQKYGGTSLNSTERIKAVADYIIRFIKEHNKKLVVVVSALGNTTDELIGLAHAISNKPDKRELDMLLATGEQVAAALLAIALINRGVPAISFNAAQIELFTNDIHTKARIKKISTNRLEKELGKNKIIIVAGFQGITEDGSFTTLGRGGSDTTAVALSAALKAEVCEIYTDVEGVYTANPRLYSGAKKIFALSYDEMLELASSGAKVLQTRAVEFAKRYNVKLYIRSSFTEAEGTMITDEVDIENVLVRGISEELDEAKITIIGVPDRPGVAALLFTKLAQANINVDMIVQSAPEEALKINNISFTVNTDDLNEALRITEEVANELSAKKVIVDDNIAKISIVGIGMRSHSGIAAQMFHSLANSGVNIEMISTSEIKISCIIKQNKVKKAIAALHKTFNL